jgi:hypothetical protein
MRKLPILVTLLTTMIASTLSTILSHTSSLPVEGYYYDEENPPVSFSVNPSTYEYFEGEEIDYSSWVFTIYDSYGDYEDLNYDSEWLSFSIPHGTTLLYGDDKTYVYFDDPSNSISFSEEIYLTITRVANNFEWISGTTNFIHNGAIDYSDWLFRLTFYSGDHEDVNSSDSYLNFSIPSGSPVYDTDNEIYVDYYNGFYNIYQTIAVSIFVEPIVTSIDIYAPGFDLVDGDIVDYSSWYFELIFSNGDSQPATESDFNYLVPNSGSRWNLTDSEVSVRYVDARTNVDVYATLAIDVIMRDFSYQLGTVTPFTLDTYFVGDVLDFTGLQVEVIETSYLTSDYYNAAELYIYSMDPYFVLTDGAILDESQLGITEIHFEINTGSFNYNSYDFGMGFSITIYPEPTYQLNFKNLVTQDVSVITDSRQASIVGDTTWLIKADEPTSLQSVEAVDSPGLVIGDDLEADFATDISFLSSSLWGVGGAANGLPIIQSIYLKAYSVNTQVEFFINGESVGFDSLNTEAGDDWIVFTIDQTTLRVGHLEMRLLQAAGDTPITLEELSIVSSNDGDPSLMDMLFFANDIEALDTCVDQSTFLTDHQFDYDSYVGSFNTTFTGLNLLDLSTPESNRDELRVTLGDKWAMMVNLHGEEAEGFGFRGSNQATNNTQTFWMGWSLILILFTFFWKKRSSDILR